MHINLMSARQTWPGNTQSRTMLADLHLFDISIHKAACQQRQCKPFHLAHAAEVLQTPQHLDAQRLQQQGSSLLKQQYQQGFHSIGRRIRR